MISRSLNRTLKLLAACLLICSSAFAQVPVPVRGTTISGKVVDLKAKQPLEFVAVSVARAKDSVTVTGAMTNKEGQFNIQSVPPGEYILKAAFIGYKSAWKTISVKDLKPIDAGTLILEEGLLLGEVELKGEIAAIKIKEDTLAYNADAYKNRPDATVEDALAKLPGVDVDKRTGVIKSQGEEVKKVTVDGKEFFGNDPKVATRNLPADAVKEYQMIDDKTEKAKTTGIDDGTREKRLNIVLREDKKGGWFGTAYAAGGTRDRYQGSLNLNHFYKDKQFSLVSSSNNVNQTNYTIEDAGVIYTLSGGAGGLTTSHSAGLNFSDAWGKKNNVNFTGSYTLSKTINTTETESIIQSSPGITAFLDSTRNNRSSSSLRNTFSSRLTVTIDSLTSFYVTPSFSSSSSGSFNNTLFSKRTIDQNAVVNAGLQRSDANSSAPLVSGALSFTRLFHQKKGSLALYVSGNYSGGNSDNYALSNNRFFQATRPDIDINRLESQGSTYYSVNINPSFSRNYGGKRSTLSFSPTLIISENTGDRYTLEYNPATGLYENRLDSLSNNTVTTARRAGFSGSYNRSGKKVGLYFTSSVANIAIDGSIKSDTYAESTGKNFWLFSPSGQVIFRLLTSRSLQFNLSSSSSAPTIGDLLIRQYNTNPLYINEGNPGLRLGRSYTGSARYSNSNIKKNTSTILTANYTRTYDGLSRSTTIDNETGIQTNKRVNLDGAYRMAATGTFTVPTGVKGLKFSPGLNASNSRNVNLSDGLKNNSDQLGLGGNVTLNYAYKDALTLALTNNTTYTHTENSVTSNIRSNFIVVSNYADISIEPFKKWRLNTDVTHNTRAGQSFVLINTGLQRYFMPKNQLFLEIKGFDLLNRNANFQRTIADNNITDMRTNNIRQYFYLKLTYKVNKLGPAAPANARPAPPPVIIRQ